MTLYLRKNSLPGKSTWVMNPNYNQKINQINSNKQDKSINLNNNKYGKSCDITKNYQNKNEQLEYLNKLKKQSQDNFELKSGRLNEDKSSMNHQVSTTIAQPTSNMGNLSSIPLNSIKTQKKKKLQSIPQKKSQKQYQKQSQSSEGFKNVTDSSNLYSIESSQTQKINDQKKSERNKNINNTQKSCKTQNKSNSKIINNGKNIFISHRISKYSFNQIMDNNFYPQNININAKSKKLKKYQDLPINIEQKWQKQLQRLAKDIQKVRVQFKDLILKIQLPFQILIDQEKTMEIKIELKFKKYIQQSQNFQKSKMNDSMKQNNQDQTPNFQKCQVKIQQSTPQINSKIEYYQKQKQKVQKNSLFSKQIMNITFQDNYNFTQKKQQLKKPQSKVQLDLQLNYFDQIKEIIIEKSQIQSIRNPHCQEQNIIDGNNIPQMGLQTKFIEKLKKQKQKQKQKSIQKYDLISKNEKSESGIIDDASLSQLNDLQNKSSKQLKLKKQQRQKKRLKQKQRRKQRQKYQKKTQNQQKQLYQKYSDNSQNSYVKRSLRKKFNQNTTKIQKEQLSFSDFQQQNKRDDSPQYNDYKTKQHLRHLDIARIRKYSLCVNQTRYSKLYQHPQEPQNEQERLKKIKKSQKSQRFLKSQNLNKNQNKNQKQNQSNIQEQLYQKQLRQDLTSFRQEFKYCNNENKKLIQQNAQNCAQTINLMKIRKSKSICSYMIRDSQIKKKNKIKNNIQKQQQRSKLKMSKQEISRLQRSEDKKDFSQWNSQFSIKMTNFIESSKIKKELEQSIIKSQQYQNQELKIKAS